MCVTGTAIPAGRPHPVGRQPHAVNAPMAAARSTRALATSGSAPSRCTCTHSISGCSRRPRSTAAVTCSSTCPRKRRCGCTTTRRMVPASPACLALPSPPFSGLLCRDAFTIASASVGRAAATNPKSIRSGGALADWPPQVATAKSCSCRWAVGSLDPRPIISSTVLSRGTDESGAKASRRRCCVSARRSG